MRRVLCVLCGLLAPQRRVAQTLRTCCRHRPGTGGPAARAGSEIPRAMMEVRRLTDQAAVDKATMEAQVDTLRNGQPVPTPRAATRREIAVRDRPYSRNRQRRSEEANARNSPGQHDAAALPIVAHAQNDSVGHHRRHALSGADAVDSRARPASPCGVVTYLGYQDASYQDATTALMDYFAGDTSLHAIVIAPTITAPQDYDHGLGRLRQDRTPQQEQMVAVVQGVEAQMGNTVDPADSVVTGGSLGGDGTQASLIDYGPKGTVQPGVLQLWRIVRRRDLFCSRQRAGHRCALRCAVDGSARHR